MSPIFVPTTITPDPEPEVPEVEPPVMHPTYNHAFTLFGGDDSTWDLVQGPVYILAGASGFGFPDPQHRWKESTNADGAIHGGLKYGIREFSLPMEVDMRLSDPAEWSRIEKEFWHALNPRHQCILTVTSPYGEVRYLPFRYSGGGDSPFELDPLIRQNNVYPIEGEAGIPFWLGQAVQREYSIEAGAPTFPGPPFYLSSSTAIENVSLTNEGDEDAWMRWTINGPYDEVTVGVDDVVITMSTSIEAGESRTIITDPAQGRSIRDQDGNLVWSEASVLGFAPIPAGDDSTIVMSMSGGLEGTSSIGLFFQPRYLRAFS